MTKKDLKLHALVAPTPVVIASAYDATGKADACTLAFYMPSSHKPPCVTIAINATQRRKTLASILESRAFAVGFPREDQVREADYLGVESGYEADKLDAIGWSATRGRKANVPVIDQMGVSLECEVVHTVTVGSHMQVTGEVVNIQADAELIDEHGKLLLGRSRPLVYDEEALVYCSIGGEISAAFRPGAEMRKQARS